MALSSRKRSVLNKLIQYVSAMRKGQISPRDGGDIRLGDMLGDYKVVVIGMATINADPTLVTVPAAKVGDLVFVQLTADDTGAPLGVVPAVALDGAVSINPAAAPTNNDGSVLFVVLRAIS